MSWEIFFFGSNLLIMGLLGVICASLIITNTSSLIYLSANIYIYISLFTIALSQTMSLGDC